MRSISRSRSPIRSESFVDASNSGSAAVCAPCTPPRAGRWQHQVAIEAGWDITHLLSPSPQQVPCTPLQKRSWWQLNAQGSSVTPVPSRSPWAPSASLRVPPQVPVCCDQQGCCTPPLRSGHRRQQTSHMVGSGLTDELSFCPWAPCAEACTLQIRLPIHTSEARIKTLTNLISAVFADDAIKIDGRDCVMWSDLLAGVNERLDEGELPFDDIDFQAALDVLANQKKILLSDCWVLGSDARSSTTSSEKDLSATCVGEQDPKLQYDVVVKQRDHSLTLNTQVNSKSSSSGHDTVILPGVSSNSGGEFPTGEEEFDRMVVDADSWEAPIWAEDAETLRADPEELGRRYARSQLAHHSGHRSAADFLSVPVQRAIDTHTNSVLQGSSMSSKHLTAGMAAEILSVLRAIPEGDWICKGRNNVKSEGVSTTHQMTLGLLSSANQFAGIPLPTHATYRYPGLCCLLLRYLHVACAEARDLPINAIQLTKNVRTKEHVDRNNRGKSIATSFGAFRGGDLWVEAECGKSIRKLSHAVSVRGRNLVQGQVMRGQRYKTSVRPAIFDGNDLHCTLPFKGERYAAIFFCIQRGNDRVPALSHAYLEHLGFRMPPEARNAPLLTATEKTVVSLFDNDVVIKDEPGRAPPPRPCQSRGIPSTTEEVAVAIKQEPDA